MIQNNRTIIIISVTSSQMQLQSSEHCITADPNDPMIPHCPAPAFNHCHCPAYRGSIQHTQLARTIAYSQSLHAVDATFLYVAATVKCCKQSRALTVNN